MAPGSLEIASFKHGYVPVLADATNLPFVDNFADVVTLNATIHHCEDMEAGLKEAARIAKTGGILITDHDPQKSILNFKGIAKVLWELTRMVVQKNEKGNAQNG